VDQEKIIVVNSIYWGPASITNLDTRLLEIVRLHSKPDSDGTSLPTIDGITKKIGKKEKKG
jgi:hypothetical protein